jgi:predicted NAD/FAD-dependent oxidoreductase
MTRVAVVGAGMAGLTLARRLAAPAKVTVFEKSRGFGGRLATRRSPPYAFDHGAQFFTARSAAFREFLAPLIEAGVVDTWLARFTELGATDPPLTRQWVREVPHYVGRPGMSAIGRHLAEGLDVRIRTRVAELGREGDGWRLRDDGGADLGHYDWVIAAAPAAQTATLLPSDFDGQVRLAQTRMLGCLALMLGFEQAPDLPFDAALVRGSRLSWISVDSSKPGRSAAPRLVALASNAWAEAHMDSPLEEVRQTLGDELGRLIGRPLPPAALTAVHRWRYANIPAQTGPRSLLDARMRLGACGDWCVYGRVEGAFLSATDLADRLLPLLDGYRS